MEPLSSKNASLSDYEDLVQSQGWRRFIEEIVLPRMHQARKALLFKSLTVEERALQQSLIKEFTALVEAPYARGGRSVLQSIQNLKETT
jgi:hypothetical protein